MRGHLLNEEECSREVVKSFIYVSSSWSLSSYLVSFSTLELPWNPSLGVYAPLSQDGTQSEGSWEEQELLWLALSLDL